MGEALCERGFVFKLMDFCEGILLLPEMLGTCSISFEVLRTYRGEAMEYPMTKAIRPVCKDVHAAIGRLPNGAFNFGLYFQKWLYVVSGAQSADRWKQRPAPWTCPMTDETKVVQRDDFCKPNILLDNFEVSLTLFNGSHQYPREFPKLTSRKWKSDKVEQDVSEKWDRIVMEAQLKALHESLDCCCEGFKKLGYESLRSEWTLAAPLVTGLGNEHPTEKGFRFHWTSGIPFVPASSLKGVVRLAALVNALNSFASLETSEAQLFIDDLHKEKWPETMRTLFGSAGEKDALRGKVMFLDAYPARLPRLKAEIMNCHYPKYYGKERGPTEDQRPNPQKYWAIDPCLDDSGARLTFVFRMLLHKDVADNDEFRNLLQTALTSALREHGLGAKTAIGHGRFHRAEVRLEDTRAVGAHEDAPSALLATEPPAQWVWEKAVLSWTAGNNMLTAQLGNTKATCIGTDLVPEALRERLSGKKKKPVTARIIVEAVGNAFKIVKVEAE
jgi:CRISPR-associated protein Cmr6